MTISGSTYWSIATSAVVILLTGAYCPGSPRCPKLHTGANDEPHRDDSDYN